MTPLFHLALRGASIDHHPSCVHLRPRGFTRKMTREDSSVRAHDQQAESMRGTRNAAQQFASAIAQAMSRFRCFRGQEVAKMRAIGVIESAVLRLLEGANSMIARLLEEY